MQRDHTAEDLRSQSWAQHASATSGHTPFPFQTCRGTSNVEYRLAFSPLFLFSHCGNLFMHWFQAGLPVTSLTTEKLPFPNAWTCTGVRKLHWHQTSQWVFVTLYTYWILVRNLTLLPESLERRMWLKKKFCVPNHNHNVQSFQFYCCILTLMRLHVLITIKHHNETLAATIFHYTLRKIINEIKKHEREQLVLNMAFWNLTEWIQRCCCKHQQCEKKKKK